LQPEEHYIRLYEQLSEKQIHTSSPFSITIDEVADRLCCTPRNAVLLLRKWEAKGWSLWKPGNGRGHRSSLALISTPEDILFEEAKRQFREGNMDRAFFVSSANSEADRRFSAWLSRHLGYRLEKSEKDGTFSFKESLHFSFYRPVGSLDPAVVVRQTEYHWISHIFDTLLRFGEDGSVLPHLAHFWEHSRNYTHWTFYMRKGILFHNGEAMTASDAMFSLNRLLDPDVCSPHEHWYKHIRRVETDGPYKLQLETSVPEPMLPQILAFPASSVLCRKEAKPSANPFRFAGSGPYELMQKHSKSMTLQAFDRYFSGRVHLDEIRMWLLPESGNSPDADKNRIRFTPFSDDGPKTSANHRELERNDLELKFLVFNLNKPGPQHDLRFRKKVARIIADADMVEELGQNRRSSKNAVFVSDDGQSLSDNRDCTQNLFGPSEPAAPLILSSYDMPLHVEDARWIGNLLSASGTACEPFVLPHEQWSKFAEPADLWLGSAVLHPSRELSELAMLCETSGPFRHALKPRQLQDLDDAIAKLRQEPEPAARRRKLAEISEELRQSCLWIPLYTTFQRTRYDARLEGVRLSAYGFPEYRNMWLRNRYE